MRQVFNKEIEKKYLGKFSASRYKLFQTIEKIYKILISNRDGRIENIVKTIHEEKPKLILEIGSGVFPLYLFLKKQLNGNYHYSICEINKEKVEYLKKIYPKKDNLNLEIVCGSAINLPYEDKHFDLVLSKGVFHHIDENIPEKRKNKKIIFLSESKRVLKLKGTVLLMDYYSRSSLKDMFWHKLYEILLGEGKYNYSSAEEAKKILRLSGFNNIKSIEIETFKGMYYKIIGKK
jgi:SAM-dependent methyltransferase